MIHVFLGVLLALGAVQESPGGRVKRKMEDYKALIDNNIFAPPGARKDSGESPKKSDPAPQAGRMLSVTGFILNQIDQRYEAVVEDREWSEKDKRYSVKEIKFCKAGDSLAGGTISEITVEQMVHVKGEKKSILKVGDQISEDGSSTRAAPTASSGGSETAVVVDDTSKEEARKRRKERFRKNTDPGGEEDEEPVVRKKRK